MYNVHMQAKPQKSIDIDVVQEALDLHRSPARQSNGYRLSHTLLIVILSLLFFAIVAFWTLTRSTSTSTVIDEADAEVIFTQ